MGVLMGVGKAQIASKDVNGIIHHQAPDWDTYGDGNWSDAYACTIKHMNKQCIYLSFFMDDSQVKGNKKKVVVRKVFNRIKTIFILLY